MAAEHGACAHAQRRELLLQLRRGLDAVGPLVDVLSETADSLDEGLKLVDTSLSAAVRGFDAGFTQLLRARVMVPARHITTQLRVLAATWRQEVEEPLLAMLDERAFEVHLRFVQDGVLSGVPGSVDEEA